MDTFRSVAETLATLAAWSVFAGAILRYFLLQWVQKREQFEREILADMKQIAAKIDTERELRVEAVEFVRSEGTTARDNLRKEAEATHRALREHVDYEDKILRDRYHDVDTRTQVLVNNIGLMREDLKTVVEGQANLVAALGVVNITLAGLAKNKE